MKNELHQAIDIAFAAAGSATAVLREEGSPHATHLADGLELAMWNVLYALAGVREETAETLPRAKVDSTPPVVASVSANSEGQKAIDILEEIRPFLYRASAVLTTVHYALDSSEQSFRKVDTHSLSGTVEIAQESLNNIYPILDR